MDSFTPLKTYQGLSINELKILINSRDIYIWGCGHLKVNFPRFDGHIEKRV